MKYNGLRINYGSFFVLMFCLTPIIDGENVFSILPALAGSILTISLSLKTQNI